MWRPTWHPVRCLRCWVQADGVFAAVAAVQVGALAYVKERVALPVGVQRLGDVGEGTEMRGCVF